MLSFFSQEYDTEFIYHLFKSSIPIWHLSWLPSSFFYKHVVFL